MMIDYELFLVCVGGIGFVLVCVLAYMWIIKDKDTSKRISRFETAIETIVKEVYKVQKTQQKLRIHQQVKSFSPQKMASLNSTPQTTSSSRLIKSSSS